MFKVLIINNKYSFDFDGKCLLDNIVYQNKNQNTDLLEIEVNKISYCFSKKWLGLIAHYEVDLDINDLIKIDFIECLSKVIGLKCGMLMIFKNKIKFTDDSYIIPGFTNFNITKNGIVRSNKSNRQLKPSIGPYGYPYVNVYDADKCKWRSVSIHLLLARTFVKNPDPVNKFFVNHKDGDKLNFSLDNLEWVTSLENQIHAIENGLRKDNIFCKVLNVDTGTVEIYPSIGSALKAIGMKITNVNFVSKVNGKLVPNLFLNKYEFKLLNDKSKWFYNKENKILSKFKNIGPFQAKNIETGEMFESLSMKALSEKVGVSSSTVEEAIKHLETKAFSGFLFRIKSDEEWPMSYEKTIYYKKRQIKLTNDITGEVIFLDSLRKAHLYLGIDKRTLKNRLKTNKKQNNWTIEEIN